MSTQSRRTAAAKTRPTPGNGNMPRARNIVKEFDTLSGAVLLTNKEVAELTGYGLATFQEWRQQGKGPKFVNVNGRPRLSVAALREWLAALPLVGR